MPKAKPSTKAPQKTRVAFGILGTTLDRGAGKGKRSKGWRPTVSLCAQPDFPIDRLELVMGHDARSLARAVEHDIREISPRTQVVPHLVSFNDPWDLEEVYDVFADIAQRYTFDVDREEYFVHISTGTHVAQICLFLLTESRFFPAKLIQTGPSAAASTDAERIRGRISLFDLDLSRYDRVASRFAQQKSDDV